MMILTGGALSETHRVGAQKTSLNTESHEAKASFFSLIRGD